MEIDEEGTVISSAGITAPLSGTRAAAVVVEAMRDGVVLATSVLGDLLRLRTAKGEIELVARRVAFAFATRFDDPAPLSNPLPPELVPLLRHRPDGFRERCILPGDRFRVRATVERQAPETCFFAVRDERGVSRLDEARSRTS